jgi:hypothetical protein
VNPRRLGLRIERHVRQRQQPGREDVVLRRARPSAPIVRGHQFGTAGIEARLSEEEAG